MNKKYIPSDWIKINEVYCDEVTFLSEKFGYSIDIHSSEKMRASNHIATIYGKTKEECINRAKFIKKSLCTNI